MGIVTLNKDHSKADLNAGVGEILATWFKTSNIEFDGISYNTNGT